MKNLALLFCLVPLAACGTASMTTAQAAAIASPTDGTVFPLVSPAVSVDIPVSFTATNFSFVAPAGQANQAGQGHAHLFVDAATSYAAAGISPLTAQGVGAGTHTLRIELHNNDHSPVDGATPAKVMVKVQ